MNEVDGIEAGATASRLRAFVPLVALSFSTFVLFAIPLLGRAGAVEMSASVALSVGLAIAANVVALVLASSGMSGVTNGCRCADRHAASGEEAWYRVRNGIAGIQSSAELAMDHASPVVYEYLEDILAESERCNATVSRAVDGDGDTVESGSMRGKPACRSATCRPNASMPLGRPNHDTGVSTKEAGVVSHRE